ncbi:MAG: ATP-binding protein [Candidatus Edwardsbacteria bacterium]|nr:ATP-binding protein [Candidatus Edwardsbacteria bacterium]MBU1575989.1 ATP-binding protein [Candidatus Edwardsbacteria bacterium]
MKYQKFTITNFKGIDKVEIDLSHNRIVSLVGLNESGKTTIMKAIKCYYDLSKGGTLTDKEINAIRPKGIDFTGEIVLESSIEYEKDDYDRIEKYWESKNKAYKIDLYKGVFKYTHKFIYELHKFKKHESSVVFPITVTDVDLQNKSKDLREYENSEWIDLLDFVKKNLIPEILFYEDFIFEIPEEIFFNFNKQATEDRNVIWQLVLDDILKCVNSRFTSFQENVVDIWNTDNDTAKQIISQIGGILNKKITKSWKTLFQKGSRKLNFKEIQLDYKTDPQKLSVSFNVKTDSGKIFSINERSKGCKWFFSFLIFTEFRKKRTKNILFLLDEPASNLHSSAQQKILEAIRDLSSNSMVIYSTHSHHLINPKWLKGSYVIINDKLTDTELKGDITFDDSAKIIAKKYFTYVGEGYGKPKVSYFQPILDALDYKPSLVEPIPNIVICEGRFDWYAFKYFCDVQLDEKDVNLYPGAGRDQLYDIIRLYLSWGKKFIVVLDSDVPGQKSKDKYIAEFGSYINNKIFTYKDILGIETDLEGLFDEQSKMAIINNALGLGSFEKIKNDAEKLKGKLNLAINHLVLDNRRIPLSDETMQKFRTAIQFMKSKFNDKLL